MSCVMDIIMASPNAYNKLSCLTVFYILSFGFLSFINYSDAYILVMNIDSNASRPEINDLAANFGPPYPSQGTQGRVVYSNPPDACGPVQSPPGPVQEDIGWILLIARGGKCRFADKVYAAQLKGYDSAIVMNYKGKDQLVKMYGNENGSFINIPSTFVGYDDGTRLKDDYNYTIKKYYVKISQDEDIDFRPYLWPFVIVVAVCFILVMVFVIIKIAREHAGRRQNRLSAKHLKKIPVRKFKKGDYYDTCAICLDEYDEGEKIRVLPCDHVYHTKCIDPWLTKRKKTCPVCKRRVIPGGDPDMDSDDDSDPGEGGSNATATNTSERTPLLAQGDNAISGYTRPGSSLFSSRRPLRAAIPEEEDDDDEEEEGIRAASFLGRVHDGASYNGISPSSIQANILVDDIVEDPLPEDAEQRSGAGSSDSRRSRRSGRYHTEGGDIDPPNSCQYGNNAGSDSSRCRNSPSSNSLNNSPQDSSATTHSNRDQAQVASSSVHGEEAHSNYSVSTLVSSQCMNHPENTERSVRRKQKSAKARTKPSEREKVKEETAEERRERRKRRKERKRATGMSSEDQCEQRLHHSSRRHRGVVNPACDVSGAEPPQTHRSVGEYADGAESDLCGKHHPDIEKAWQIEIRQDKKERGDEGEECIASGEEEMMKEELVKDEEGDCGREDYINPSYSSSQEVVLVSPASKRHEMNDIV